MSEIKLHQDLIYIELYDWTVLYTGMSDTSKLNEMLNDVWKFIKIGEDIVNKKEIKKCFKQQADDIAVFISSKDPDTQRLLREILQEREKKHFKTNWSQHLWDIYISRHWN